MKFMTTWTVQPGTLKEVMKQFLATQGGPAEGVNVTVLGRWHKADFSGGFVLVEASDAGALYDFAADWADLLEFHTVPVIEDADAAPFLKKVFTE